MNAPTQAAPVLELMVNGTAEQLAVSTVSGLLDAKGVDRSRKGIAVALNGAVVPRRSWEETRLAAGDAVEIIQAKQGG